MEALDNKCPSCSAKIDFDPKEQLWHCDYCGSKFTLEEMKKYKNASNEKANEVLKKEKELKGFSNFHCKNCGAEILADETTTATFCVYCGSTAILKEKIDDGRAPDLIIPFKNTKDVAAKSFAKLTKNKPLMPRKFKDIKNIDKISGVYIPFWAFDVESDGDITFACTDTMHWSDSRYSYTKVSNFDVTINTHLDFSKVLADGSSRFDDDLMDSLEPFNFKDLVDYNHAYLSGFLAEKYDVLEDGGFNRASDRCLKTCIDMSRGRCGHQTNIVKNNAVSMKKINSYYIMLPVWMVNIIYNNKTYTFAVNGQTGKMVGNIPIGKKETIIWSILIFIILFVIGYLFNILM